AHVEALLSALAGSDESAQVALAASGPPRTHIFLPAFLSDESVQVALAASGPLPHASFLPAIFSPGGDGRRFPWARGGHGGSLLGRVMRVTRVSYGSRASEFFHRRGVVTANHVEPDHDPHDPHDPHGGRRRRRTRT